MVTVEKLVQTWMASGRSEEVDETVSNISNGQISLVQVVKALGEYLTAEEDLLRTKGVEFLSLVIERCPPEKINRQATRTLLLFYFGKLDDTETITPALTGLVSLLSLPTITSADVMDTMNAIFVHVKMRAHIQSTRFSVYKIVDLLMAKHRADLQDMGDTFLSEYVALVDGEKDPRNLSLVFPLARVICIEFDITKHVEDLFNIIFCYFPISFKPPADDPFHITPDDLRNSLRSCLNATPAFGPLAMPLFLEKLTAGTPPTKKDTLETLSCCLPIYGPSIAQKFSRDLWNLLKLEVFQPTNAELEVKALETTRVLVRIMHPSEKMESDKVEDVVDLVQDICAECLNILREPEKSQAKPAIKVLSALVGSSPSVSRYAISQAIPHLLRLFRVLDEVTNRPQILSLLSTLLAAIKDAMSRDPSSISEPLMLSFKDDLQKATIAGLGAQNTKNPALDCIDKLIKMHGFLSEDDIAFIVKNINDVIGGDDDDSKSVRDKALDVLVDISKVTPQIIQESTLPCLFGSLSDQAPSHEDRAGRAQCWRTLHYLTKLCLEPSLFETFVVRLLTKVEFNCVSPVGPDLTVATEPTVAYAHSILKAIVDALELKIAAGHTDIPKYLDRLVRRLYNMFLFIALSSDRRGQVVCNEKLLKVAGSIITLVTQTVHAERQKSFAKALMSAYMDGDLRDLAQGHYEIPTNPPFQPFNEDAPLPQKNAVFLFSAGIIALQKEVPLLEMNLAPFLTKVLVWGVDQTESDIQRSASSHIGASVLNKRTAELSQFIDTCLDNFWPEKIFDADKSVSCRRSAVQSWAWIARAVAIQNHERTMQLVQRLLELFDDPDISWDAARAIGQIGCGPDDVLSKRNHAVIRILSVQRYFKGLLPQLLGIAKDPSRPSRRTAGLVALISLLSVIPKSIYTPHLPELVPLLLTGLELPDLQLRSEVIDILLTTAEIKYQVVLAEHSSTLISMMLKNSILREDATSPRIRTAALKYLGVLPTVMQYDVLHPHKSLVIRELGKALDDPKRGVRKAAVDARTIWVTFRG